MEYEYACLREKWAKRISGKLTLINQLTWLFGRQCFTAHTDAQLTMPTVVFCSPPMNVFVGQPAL